MAERGDPGRRRGTGKNARPRTRAEIAEAGAAHDLANLLAVIGGSAAMLAEDLSDLPPHHPAREHVERILTVAARAGDLIERLPGRTPPAPRPKGTHDLGAALREAQGLIAPLVPRGVAFEAVLTANTGPARGAPLDAVQLLLNLVLNARDAVGGRGRITASLSVAPAAPLPEPAIGRVVPGRSYAAIRVADTGPGLDTTGLPALLTPGETSKGPGRGWGLAIVADIVRRIGGVLRVAETREGAAIEVLWPLAPSDRIADLTGRTALVVAGPSSATARLCDTIEAAGVEVALCLDPRDAIASVREDRGEWDAVIVTGDTRRAKASTIARRLREADATLPLLVPEGVKADGPTLALAKDAPGAEIAAAFATLTEPTPCAS